MYRTVCKEDMKNCLKKQTILLFQKTIYDFYKDNKRLFDWRYTEDPYHVFVSEIMLQQTQTSRVIHKFDSFITQFPSLSSLARASLHDVLTAWQGLGYNRRGKFLHDAAQLIEQNYNGIIPQTPELLVTLPGIGKATSCSIVTFAYNIPTIFIETNIRSVFIHHFFKEHTETVKDADIFPLIEATIDTHDPRSWYYALMDYGVFLKKQFPNPSRKSAHHTKQSRFEGSDRQIRGAILMIITEKKEVTVHELLNLTNSDIDRLLAIIKKMCAEGLLQQRNNTIFINIY